MSWCYEYPCVVQTNLLLYCQFIALPHVVVDQFVCIAQEDYCRILNHVEKNTHKVEEEGEIVMVKEHRELDRSGTRKGHIVIKVRKSHRSLESIIALGCCCRILSAVSLMLVKRMWQK